MPLLTNTWLSLAFCAFHFLGFDSVRLPGDYFKRMIGIQCMFLVGIFVGIQVSADLWSRWQVKERHRGSLPFTLLSACFAAFMIALDLQVLPEFRMADLIQKQYALLYYGALHFPAVVWFVVNVMRFVKTNDDASAG